MLVQWNFCSLFQDLQQFAREEWHFASLVSTLTVDPTVPQQLSSCGGVRSAIRVCVVGESVARAIPLNKRSTKIQPHLKKLWVKGSRYYKLPRIHTFLPPMLHGLQNEVCVVGRIQQFSTIHSFSEPGGPGG